MQLLFPRSCFFYFFLIEFYPIQLRSNVCFSTTFSAGASRRPRPSLLFEIGDGSQRLAENSFFLCCALAFFRSRQPQTPSKDAPEKFGFWDTGGLYIYIYIIIFREISKRATIF